MTQWFQPLDLTVNKYAKDYFKQKFCEWFSKQLHLGIERGQTLEDINIKYTLSVLKPLHARWIVDFYNHMTTPKGREVCTNGWNGAGIADAIKIGSEKLPSLDPFQDICPISDPFSFEENNAVFDLAPKDLDCFREKNESDGDSDWEPDKNL